MKKIEESQSKKLSLNKESISNLNQGGAGGTDLARPSHVVCYSWVFACKSNSCRFINMDGNSIVLVCAL